ncbi:hypothetical protein Y699_05525 [Aspergillus fumigatus Z5]|nr:hypothetical protein Y699_05525 [Aspergillus fumigatus Z5]
MRLLSLTLLLSAAVALPSAEKSCSGVGFPCGNATVNAYDCCVPLVCAPGALREVGQESQISMDCIYRTIHKETVGWPRGWT